MSELAAARERVRLQKEEAERKDKELRKSLILSAHPGSVFCPQCDSACEGKTREEALELAVRKHWTEPVPGRFVCSDCNGSKYDDPAFWQDVVTEDKKWMDAHPPPAPPSPAPAADATPQDPAPAPGAQPEVKPEVKRGWFRTVWDFWTSPVKPQ